jgi:two-component system, NtrC family, sensor histidine kinase GlrK
VNLYPRSFLGLVVLGSAIAMLPLLAAMAYAKFAIDDLTAGSGQAFQQTAQVATLGYALDEELGQMERVLRQYDALRDPILLDDYAVVRADWRDSIAKFVAIPALAPLVARANTMRDAEAAGFARLGSRGEGVPPLKATLAVIDADLQRLAVDSARLMQQQRQLFLAQARMLSARLMAAVAAALVLSGVMLWSGRNMLGRLLVRLERAVVALGEGRLNKEIRLKGPADLQRVGLRLDWLRRRLIALETERTRVLRHVSHELKTPLAAIREGASLLHDGVVGPLTPSQEKVAAIMQANAVRLQFLIDALLSMQRANHVRDKMETSAIRFDEVVKETLVTYQLAMRGRQLRFAGTLAPLTVQGSAEALATLTSNLVSNAIKFSPDGGKVRVHLSCQEEQAVLDVIDDGPGVPAEDRNRIFQPFYRAPAARNIEGVGLGLAIANEFAMAHRGTLECLETERGAHFRLQLPVAAGATE